MSEGPVPDYDTRLKEQAILNRSFDFTNNALYVIPLAFPPTSPKKNNPSLIISKNAAGKVVKLEKILNGVTYTKTLSNDDMTVATTQTISAWS